LSWNIGYAGLGKEMDFFYDGGKQVRPSKSLNQSYLNSILEFLGQNKEVDFILLQEVDEKSGRSYRINQVEKIAETLPKHAFSFAKNYDVPFVPVPPTNPMGLVKSGLVSFAKYTPFESERRSFPGNYAWPTSLFMLDRCFLVQRFKTSGNTELIVVNTHNSAFDDGQLRKGQLDVLKKFALNEYLNGNYVIIGGDWNQNPPGFDPGQINTGNIVSKNDQGNISSTLMPPGWVWAFDPLIPTNRSVVAPYQEESTLTTVIDFFLLSPNISLEKVTGINLNFESSDHNPVLIEILLK
ncbi:MAG: hypothetical protein K9H16_11020, partial [Bacteroidales bacterium]|nr:hypothetical protein [Bacteroidales bacterium]